jgi:hypothetical protein
MPLPLIAIRAPEAIFQGKAGRAVATKQGSGRNAIALGRHSGAGRNPVTMLLGFREKPAWLSSRQTDLAATGFRPAPE